MSGELDIPTLQEEKPPKKKPAFNPNKPFKEVKEDKPPFDPNKPYSEKKNLGENTVNNSGTSSPPSQSQLNVEIPTVDLGKPLQDGNNVEGNAPSDENDVVAQAKYAKELENKIIVPSEQEMGMSRGAATARPDEVSIEASKKIKSDLESKGYNAEKLANDFDLPDYVFHYFPKEQLLDDYKNNPAKYEREIATSKWQSSLLEKLREEGKDDLFHGVLTSINNITNSQIPLDSETKRDNVRDIVRVINEHGGDKKDEMLKHLSTDLSNEYVKEGLDESKLADDPLSKTLNAGQISAYHLMEDINPKELNKYKAAFIDDKDIKDNYEAKLQKQEALKRLDEISIQMKKSYANEHLAPLLKEYQGLITKSETQPLAPEEQMRMQELEQQGKQFSEVLNQSEEKEHDLVGQYPIASRLDANNFAQELVGQKHTGLDWMAIEMGKATDNTARGIMDFVKTPFLSDKENEINQAEILGNEKLNENVSHLNQSNQTSKTFKPVLSKELQTDVDAIKNDPNLSGTQKTDKVTDLLLSRSGEWQRSPESKTNIGLTSLMYGVGGLAANLAPFMAAEMVTGGGASAGVVRKFTSAFTSAAATGFHDAYAQALEKGSANPFADAMRVTAINSAAMAGAGTPDAIREMLGNKTAIGKLINGMTDDAIEAALKQEPKALSTFRKAYEGFKGTIKNIPNAAMTGLKQGAKLSAFTTGGQIANDAIDNELKSPEDYAKQAAIETLKFTVLGTIGGSLGKKSDKPTDISLAALHEAARNPEPFNRALDVMEKKGNISPEDAAQVRKNVDRASKIYNTSQIFKTLSEKGKREYLYNALIKTEAKESSSTLPPKQAETAEHTAMVADHKNGLLVENLSMDKLESRQSRLEKILEPKTDDTGKKIELPEKQEKEAKAELQAVKETIEERQSENVANERAKELSEKLKADNETTTSPEIPVEPEIHKPTEAKEPTATEVSEVVEPTGEGTGEEKITGIAQRVREKRADVLGLPPAEIGVGWTKEEALKRGRELVQDGVNPQQVIEDFKKDGKISDDSIAIVQAETHRLARETNAAGDKYGTDSKEYKEALQKEDDWLKETKPMQTVWSRAGVAQQGDIDIDTGTVTGLSRAFKKESGRDFTPAQTREASKLAKQVQDLTKKTEDLEKQVKELLNKETSPKVKSEKAIKEAANNLAKKIRENAKLSRPGSFSAATPASVVWDGAVEIVAKAVEAGGTLAQGIADGIEYIKESDWYKSLPQKEQQKAENTFTDWHKEQNKFDFADKVSNKFLPEEVRVIWEHAKRNYIDKGDSFEKMIQGTAIDFGLTPKQVRRALTEPKGAKKLTDEMYKTQYQRTTAMQKAETWVKRENKSNIVKFFRAIPDVFFGIKTFGHGTVGGITHAGTSIFKPSRWKVYWPFFGKQFSFAFGKTADYEKAMTDLKNDPDFPFWKRAGLAVDPKLSYDEYQRVGRFMGRIANTGERGFNALKVFRLNLAKSFYDGLSDSAKADPNTAKEIAKLVNHASGTSDVKLPSAASVVFFAPRLEASRWQRLITDPGKALVTFTRWNKASEADKAMAIREAKNSGEIIATYLAALAANAGLLAAAGSSQRVNFTDPSKSDWLKFKVFGKTIDPTGGILSAMNFLSNMIQISAESKDKLHGKSRADAMANRAWGYGTGKFSPFAATVKDFATHKDFTGNVMPFSADKPATGKHKLGWWEYLGDQQLPIPISEGIKEARESMKEKGMSDVQIDDVLKGLAGAVIVGGSGIKLGNEPSVHIDKTKNHLKKGKKNY